ncbi:putative disease resistance RPP13-like protein 1 [Vitis vinifera]|uniref:Putative disease resistance RPP13-like protein 1 n=1 Tax=Vitis vinifera TaxID=29760 RepID=A0A438GWL2_VITVI|nr:putative disease resistance RPP13-like protein 1 [Vitis vinifera]
MGATNGRYRNLIKLPTSIGNLINLRYLDISGDGLKIKDLRDMSHLKGEICISKLEKVENIQDARNANLNTKHNLEGLTMKWNVKLNDSQNGIHEMDVLDSLQPHSNLNKLSIVLYDGPKFPRWIMDASFSKMLGFPLPRLPSICELHTEECNEVFLPMLQVLQISECGELTYFRKNGFGLENLAHLQQLEISSCPQLVSLEEDKEQGHPCNLQYLRIEHCDKLEKLPNVWQYLTCLEELEIKDCPNLMSFPEMGFPPMLRRLSIQNCEALKSLPDGMMRRRNINDTNTMCLLQYLRIDNCPSLICFPKGQLPNGALARSTLLKHSCIGGIFPEAASFSDDHRHRTTVSSSQNSHRSSHKKIPQSRIPVRL